MLETEIRLIKNSKKVYRCSFCGRKIPLGSAYWRKFNEDGTSQQDAWIEHTNCLEFEKQPILNPEFNTSRRKRGEDRNE